VQQRVVQISVTRWVPRLLVIISSLGAREQRFLVDSRIPRLIEGGDTQLLVGVFLDDTESVFVRVEGRHEDKGHVNTAGGVEMLNLANGEVKESHVVLDFQSALSTSHTYGTSALKLLTQRGRNVPIEVPRPPLTLRTASLFRFLGSEGVGSLA
jgi:hypothetical protein